MLPIAQLSRLALAAGALLLAGCSMDILSFGSGDRPEQSRTPANSTEYRCDGGKRFHVRTLDADSVWLILPEREVRLTRSGGNRYATGRTVLEINGASATLTDPPAPWSGCKAPAAG